MCYSMRTQQNIDVKETSSHCQASFKNIIRKYMLLKTSVSGKVTVVWIIVRLLTEGPMFLGMGPSVPSSFLI